MTYRIPSTTDATARRREAARRGGLRAQELRRESFDAVARDVADDWELSALWKRHHHRVRAGERLSRTEAFVEWVAEHPEAVADLWREVETAGAAAEESEAEYLERMDTGSADDWPDEMDCESDDSDWDFPAPDEIEEPAAPVGLSAPIPAAHWPAVPPRPLAWVPTPAWEGTGLLGQARARGPPSWCSYKPPDAAREWC